MNLSANKIMLKVAMPFLLAFILIPLVTFSAGGKQQPSPIAGLHETAVHADFTNSGTPPGANYVTQMTGNVISSALSLVGVVFFILIVYGGFVWMTAQGKEDQVTKGKETVIAAIIGMIIIIAAYAITTFVFNSPTAGGPTP